MPSDSGDRLMFSSPKTGIVEGESRFGVAPAEGGVDIADDFANLLVWSQYVAENKSGYCQKVADKMRKIPLQELLAEEGWWGFGLWC